MFKKFITVAALVGFGIIANSSIASAHQNGYKHKHGYKHKQGYQKVWRGGLPMPVIRKRLRNRGFHRIRFTDRRLPVYKAVACKRGKRVALRINRWGKVMNRHRIGRCGYRNYR